MVQAARSVGRTEKIGAEAETIFPLTRRMSSLQGASPWGGVQSLAAAFLGWTCLPGTVAAGPLPYLWHAVRVSRRFANEGRTPAGARGRSEILAGRAVPCIYQVARRADLIEFLLESVRRSGGTVLYASVPTRVPVYLGLQDRDRQRLGLLIYPFRMKRVHTRNRPSDEIRGQLRYGAERSWAAKDHAVARDIAGVDTTLLLGLDPEEEFIVGLDPALYDPLPLGISVYAKDQHAEQVRQQGWTVWERVNRAGSRRVAPRGPEGLETLVGLGPHRLLDYARFERNASDLGLDPPLRYAAAVDAASERRRTPNAEQHRLEQSFGLTAREILDIIHSRMRLEVAVKGGVAEHHLGRLLRADPAVASVAGLDRDGQPDFEVQMRDGRTVRVECKNVSPERYANGDFKVEVQKTRATSGDRAGRLYRPSQFDVVAACLYSPTRRWDFRFIRSSMLARHPTHGDRLAATHRVDVRWTESLEGALADFAGAS
jgi:hypothetical protein